MQDFKKSFLAARILEDLPNMILTIVVFNESPHAFARTFSIYFSSITMKHPLKVAALKTRPKFLTTNGIGGDSITWNFAKIVILNVHFQNLNIM